ncbi:28S ribosomal protein S18c, mitochondrial [Pseudomyrmex gracilis]|uniref:28S ribosomal protein S18c, mitochondrial n=1 Tax=Pseudomyrmex gracilis TaxID=219809 RepID=UPI0009954062|nr:28S ribosomal protein S18c, mitochondrial [Pseudomyrmex gracilis]XP_020286088.1 28S ribosomal protein S18c, mitochondrial [Pseudomyrmex gracilis]
MFSIALKRSKLSSISKVYTSRLQTTSKSLVNNLASIEKDKPISIENPYVKEKRQCLLCKLDIEPDYKNVRFLSQFQSRHTGRIYGKHITGLCEYKQKRVEEEILKAQSAGLMGYWTKEPEYVKDPPLFDPNHPFRPHKY